MEGSRFGTRCLSASAALVVAVGVFVATISVAAQQPAAPAQQPDAPAQQPDTPAPQAGTPAPQAAAASAAPCRVGGTITGLGAPLPGVAITARKGYLVQSATSTSVDGAYRLSLPAGVYQLTIDLTGFDRIQRELTVSGPECAQSVDATMALSARTPAVAAAPAGRGEGPNGNPAPGVAAGGRGAGGRGTARGFETLAVTEDADTAGLAALLNAAEAQASAAAQSLLPAGFDSEASADAFAVTGEASRVNNGLLNDRRDAINRGDFAVANGDAGGAFGADGGNPTLGGLGGAGGAAQGGGRGGAGRGGNQFNLGGRGGRQGRIQIQANYGFSGSPLNSAPRQLRSEVRGEETPTANHNFGTTLGGPIRIPGLYENATNRSTFTLSYTGNTGTQLFDQYATVPTESMRAGDFSASGVPLIDPTTGEPFPGNQIPADRISPQALALLGYFPAANLTGNTRNYHYSTSTASDRNQVQVRISHNFSGTAAGGRGGGRGGGAAGGGANPPQSNAGQAGQGRRLLGTRTNVTMNAQVQYLGKRRPAEQRVLEPWRSDREYEPGPPGVIQHSARAYPASAQHELLPVDVGHDEPVHRGHECLRPCRNQRRVRRSLRLRPSASQLFEHQRPERHDTIPAQRLENIGGRTAIHGRSVASIH